MQPFFHANTTTYKHKLLLINLILTIIFSSHQSTAESAKPNIILIFADDLGYNDVGYTGKTPIQTPNIDKLAASGVIFENGYVSHPYCGPSRAGLMTGRYQARFGMDVNPSYSPFDVDQGVPLTERFFPEQLQSLGYKTGIIGKWHLGAEPRQQPNHRGFDYFFGFLGGGHSYYETDLTTKHTNDADELIYSQVEGSYLPLQRNKESASFTGYLTNVLSEDASDFISTNKENPFFLYLAYNAPHSPLQAPEELPPPRNLWVKRVLTANR